MGRKPFEPLSEAEIAYGRAHYGTGLNSDIWGWGPVLLLNAIPIVGLLFILLG